MNGTKTNGNKMSSTHLADLLQNPASLPDIVQKLKQDVDILAQFYTTDTHPAPSFDQNAPTASIPNQAPLEVKMASDAVMDNALRLFDLCSGPTKILSHLTVAYQTVACLRWLCHFEVFREVPLEGTITFQDLATRSKVPLASLKTVARMVMTARILCEPEREHVQHTAASALLAKSRPLHDWALIMGLEPVDIAMKMVEATEKWPGSTKTNETAFNVALDTDLAFFKHLQTRPDHLHKYTEYQRAVASTEGLDLRHVVNGYDWAALDTATVVDVGGAEGLAAVALAREYPKLSFVVQELSDVVAVGQKYLAGVENESIKSRVSYEVGDFFEEQPVNGAEVYLVRMVLHYWSAEDCVRILKRLVLALTPGKSRIVVMDTVLPTPGKVSTLVERQLRVRDLAMMQLQGNHERSEEDWQAIFTAADPRLEMRGCSMPFGSEMSIMELVLA